MRKCEWCNAVLARRASERGRDFAERRTCGKRCGAALKTRPLEERFEQRLATSGECLVWTGHKNTDGYGKIRVGNTMKLAHRVAWELATGRRTSKKVLHRCDQPACCKPEHLFVGSQRDNVRDCMAKGRRADLRGKNNPNYKDGRSCRSST